MIITREQMAALDQCARRAGNIRLADYIEARFPGILGGLGIDERIAVVERYRAKAAESGFTTDEQIGYFMDLTVMYGVSFALDPLFRPIMSDTRLSADDKLAGIKTRLRREGVAL